MLSSHPTNLGLEVIRSTQRLGTSPVTDRITLNHLHSGGGVGGGIAFRGRCNHNPYADMGKVPKIDLYLFVSCL